MGVRGFACIAILAWAWVNPVAAQQVREPLSKSNVVLGVGSASGVGAYWWIAEELGYFKDEGLAAQILAGRSVTLLQGVIGGQVDATISGCAEAFRAIRSGFDVKIVANTTGFNPYLIAARKEIVELKQLVGKVVAVNRRGDTDHLSIRHALRKHAVNPDSVTYLEIGSTPERFAALLGGVADAAAQASMLRGMLTERGFNVLYDFNASGEFICSSGIVVSGQLIAKHRSMVLALMRASVRGNAAVKTLPPQRVKEILSKYMKRPPTHPLVDASYQGLLIAGHVRKPYLTLEMTKSGLAIMAEEDPSWRTEDPARFVDMSFLAQLDKEGYLDRVYK